MVTVLPLVEGGAGGGLVEFVLLQIKLENFIITKATKVGMRGYEIDLLYSTKTAASPRIKY